ncbi:hypothetical protein [Nocardioides sp.]|uniref:hypothetical protein n=1 Tax=Nocardioides sp. TaxID=35761 RepID=UPI0031FE9498|nr:hypothetical protein [Nocardioides sp.]
MKVALTGNSHVWSLRRGSGPPGLDALVFGLGNGKYERRPFTHLSEDGVVLDVPQYAEALTRATGLRAIDTSFVWGFCSVNHNSRLYRDDTWLAYEPAAIRRGDRVAVSEELLRTMIESDQAGVRALFDHLLEAGVDFFAISAPPPRRDNNGIRKGIRPEVVRYVDRTAREIWATWLDERKIPVLQPPPSTVDDEGFLLEGYHSEVVRNGVPDRHHASAEYGTVVMAQVADHVSSKVDVA